MNLVFGAVDKVNTEKLRLGVFVGTTNAAFSFCWCAVLPYVKRISLQLESHGLGKQECLFKVCTAIVVQLQSRGNMMCSVFLPYTFKDEQTILCYLEVIAFLISTCASEEMLGHIDQ